MFNSFAESGCATFRKTATAGLRIIFLLRFSCGMGFVIVTVFLICVFDSGLGFVLLFSGFVFLFWFS